MALGVLLAAPQLLPSYELKRLGDDHQIYKIQFKIPAHAKSLTGISNGVRLLAIHSPRRSSSGSCPSAAF